MQRIKEKGFTTKEAAKILKMDDKSFQKKNIDTGKLKICLIEGRSRFIGMRQVNDAIQEKLGLDKFFIEKYVEEKMIRQLNMK